MSVVPRPEHEWGLADYLTVLELRGLYKRYDATMDKSKLTSSAWEIRHSPGSCNFSRRHLRNRLRWDNMLTSERTRSFSISSITNLLVSFFRMKSRKLKPGANGVSAI